MDRRALLASLAAVASLAGCPALSDAPAPERSGGPDASTPTPQEDRVGPQSLSVDNARGEAEYVTVAVERDGRTAFVDSVALVPGERWTFEDVLARAGRYRVIVETATGERWTTTWRVVPALDGLYVTLADGVDAWRTLLCDPDCNLATAGTSADVPLIGDGSLRWYGAAGLVVRNPSSTRIGVDLAVTLDGASILDYRYELPGETQAVIPVTYRSGTYRVRVDAGGRTAENEWPVPEVPRRHVSLGAPSTGDPIGFGCGPANTTLQLVNRDDRAHRLTVEISRDGERRFHERYDLQAGVVRTVTPVAESGPYEVRAGTDTGEETTATWWSCPPHGPAAVVVDATGTVSVRGTPV